MPEAVGGTKKPSGGQRMPQDGTQKAPEGPRMPKDGSRIRVFTCFPCDPFLSYVFLRVGGRFDAPGWLPDTCFYVFSLRVADAPG